MNKRVAIILVFLSILSLCAVNASTVKASPKTITVPDDYPTIQAAIDNAIAGDTIFVKKGTYNEIVTVDKSLSLIGEDSQETVIKGAFQHYGIQPNVIQITADGVTISGFTITSDEVGILIDAQSRCKVIGNNIVYTTDGIWLESGSDHVVSGNNITSNFMDGIRVSSSNTTISGNNITGNIWNGIIADFSKNVTISENNISNNGMEGDGFDQRGGLYLRWWGPFYVYGNNITNNVGTGIGFGEYCGNSSISNNNITNNAIGIQLYFVGEGSIGKDNKIYKNNIEGNSQQVVVNQTSDIATFDNGDVGNYWSDYQTRYPNAKEIDASGISNTPYVIDEKNIDHYPLTQLVNISTAPPSPSPPTANVQPLTTDVIAIAATIAVVAIAAAVYGVRRKRKQLTVSP